MTGPVQEVATGETRTTRPAAVRGRLARDPLTRTAWPLVVNTGSNAVLGVAFWVVAARLYDSETLASNTALVAAMTTLSGISQLNLGPALAVLLPRAGSGARQVLLRVYATVTAYSVVVLGVFTLVLLPLLGNLSAVLDSGARVGLFAAAVLAFNLFALQDAALVALRLGRFVPVENAVFGITKVTLLVVFGATLPALGIFVSWVVPMLLLVPVVSTLLLRARSVERRVSATPEDEPVGRLAADYVGYLFQVASTFFLPVIAFELLPPSGAALFSIAWLTSSTLDLLATNVGTALTVETSYGEDPHALRRTIMLRALPLLAGICVLGLVAAPLIMRVYGGPYAAHGVLALQILLAASVPRALVTFAVAEARAHRRIGVIVALRAQNAVLVLGLSVLLAPALGVEGMAVAWLSAQIAGGASAWWQVFRREAPAGRTLR